MPSSYAGRLAQHAHRIVGAVHDDGPNELLDAIGRALGLTPPPDTDPVVALCTVLAAMVDPATTTEQRLGWVHALDRPDARRPQAVTAPVSEFLAAPAWADMSRAQRAAAIARLERKGLSAPEIAARLRITERTVARRRAARRAAASVLTPPDRQMCTAPDPPAIKEAG